MRTVGCHDSMLRATQVTRGITGVRKLSIENTFLRCFVVYGSLESQPLQGQSCVCRRKEMISDKQPRIDIEQATSR